jgi:proline racemase
VTAVTHDAHVGAAERSDLGGLGATARIEFVDYHTAGEPFRIVGGPLGGLPTPVGDTVLERRTWIRRHLDGARRLLVNEPRGHADMYGGWVVPSDGADATGEDAVFGVVFFHKDGYSTACGHGSMALGAWALDAGLVAPPAGDASGSEARFWLDVPSGRVRLTARVVEGRATLVRFRNVPSWVAARSVAVATSLGPIQVDVSYGGAFYASARTADLGLKVCAEQLPQLIAVGREIKWALNGHPAAVHPVDARLSGMYGTIWWEDGPGGAVDRVTQRNVTVFADGEVDRSPCGSGTSARLAVLAADGLVTEERPLEHWSIVDTRFVGRVLGPGVPAPGSDGSVPTVLTEVEGSASPTASGVAVLEPGDETGLGFQLR